MLRPRASEREVHFEDGGTDDAVEPDAPSYEDYFREIDLIDDRVDVVDS